LIEHLKSFDLDLKFSAGIWFFSPSDSRFHEKYGPDLTIEQRLEIARGLKQYGLAGLEAHYPSEINEENEKLWRDFCADTGIRLVTVVPLLFRSREFEFGSLSSPLPESRKAAIEVTRRALEMNCRMDTDFCVVWPGIDGYENPFGIDFAAMRDRFADGLAEAMDCVPGVRVAFAEAIRAARENHLRHDAGRDAAVQHGRGEATESREPTAARRRSCAGRPKSRGRACADGI
jgi:xylose isomerase